MIEKLKTIYDSGVDFNTYFKLLICEDNSTYMFEKIDFTDLKMLGYINFECKLTELGTSILNKCENNVNIINKKEINKFIELYKTLQNELVRLTGKKQIKANGAYTFLCNEVDLKNKLSKVIIKYKLKDWEKIKKLLLLHIQKAKKQNFDKVMLVGYYIEKNGNSTLASDYEGFEIGEEKINENIQPKEIKTLF